MRRSRSEPSLHPKDNNTGITEMLTKEEIVFKIANTEKEFEDGRYLYQQYANSLDFDLSFQNFSEELETIGQQYNKPKGALLLAYKNEIPVGCVGIREHEHNTSELKRLYVRPDYRSYKIGKKLLELALDIAKQLHYKYIRLDTISSQSQAQNLYRSFGFYEISPYRFNPISGTVYMEKKLD